MKKKNTLVVVAVLKVLTISMILLDIVLIAELRCLWRPTMQTKPETYEKLIELVKKQNIDLIYLMLCKRANEGNLNHLGLAMLMNMQNGETDGGVKFSIEKVDADIKEVSEFLEKLEASDG